MDRVIELIEKYGLEPHPEGGYFKEEYRSNQLLQSPISANKRNAVTHIYFLLTKGQFSRFHKVVHDEIWNYYEGDPIRLVEYDGSEIVETVIGPGEKDYYKVIKGGVFQAAESTGIYTLVGCTVAPGFDFKDFSFLNVQEVEDINKNHNSYAFLV